MYVCMYVDGREIARVKNPHECRSLESLGGGLGGKGKNRRKSCRKFIS
jgi:hypothetical protein